MLTNLRSQIREFAQHAEDCRREAETAPSAVRDHYVKLEKHYLILAQHYLLTLEEAERSYGWASHRTRHAQASFAENPFEKAGADQAMTESN